MGTHARRLSALLVVVVLSSCTDDGSSPGVDATSTSARPVEPVVEPVGPTMGELVAGEARVVDGAFVWTDYVYDDHGANVDAGDGTVADDAGGDTTYPDGNSNAADIVQVQLVPGDDETEVVVVLETLVDPAIPEVTLDLDVHDDEEADEHLTLTMSASSTDLDSEIDVENNTLRASIALDDAPRTVWNLRVTAGVAGVAHDLAFVRDEPYQWQDYLQADILGGKAPVIGATATIDWGDLHDEGADGRSPGFHTYLYRSEVDLGEGVEPAEGGLQYLGRYQPYLVYLPEDGVDPQRALTVFLHGLEQNHVGSVTAGGVYLGTARPLSEELHQLAPFARDGLDFPPYNMTVWPLARGEGLDYRGIAERDVLDVLADASRRLEPDPDRIILEGASMGGIGAFRLGALHPDRFSVVVPVIGYATSDIERLLTNMWQVPIRQINGAKDQLIDADLARATTDALDRYGLGFRSWMLDDRGHEAGGFVYDCVYESLPSFVRVTAPARVRYSLDPTLDRGVAAGVDLDLPRGNAYWVSGVEAAGESIAVADLTSDALERPERSQVVHVSRTGSSVAPGGDLCGVNPEVVTGDTWTERGVYRDEDGEAPSDQRLTGSLIGVAALTIDAERAGLISGEPGQLELTTGVPAAVTLVGLGADRSVTAGSTEHRADHDGRVTVQIAIGTTLIELGAG